MGILLGILVFAVLIICMIGLLLEMVMAIIDKCKKDKEEYKDE